VRLVSCESKDFAERVLASAPLELSTEFRPLLETLQVIDRQLQSVDAELGKLCAHEPVIQQLCTVPGVGAIIAASFVSVIDDAKRFHRAHQVESYVGLVPSEDSSGGKRRVGAITKQGNRYLRAMLVQGAWAVMRNSRKDDPLRLWGHALSERRGKRIAVVAVARRLIGILWAIWRDGTVYDLQWLSLQGARGLRAHAQDLEVQAAALKAVARKRSCKLLLQREVTSG
jgi:transposase